MKSGGRDVIDTRRHPRRDARLAAVASPMTHGHIRRTNAWSVLQVVRATGITSRTQITERTGLTAMSVHRLIADLRRRRLVVSAGTSNDGAIGRPSSLFRFNASIGHVIGVDVGNETTRAVLADLDLVRHARVEVPQRMSSTISSVMFSRRSGGCNTTLGSGPNHWSGWRLECLR